MLMVLTVGLLCSCGSDNEDDDGGGKWAGGNGKAPTDLRGHEFNFFYEYGGELYRSITFSMNKNGDFSFLSYSATNITDYSLLECTKTSANSMHIEIQAYYMQAGIDSFWDGSYYQDPEHNYEIDLTFIDDDQGIADVTTRKKALDMYGSLKEQVDHSTWYFRMDSSVKPDKGMIDAVIDGEIEGEAPLPGDDESGDVEQSDSQIEFKIIRVTSTGFVAKATNGVNGICCGTSPNPTIYDRTSSETYNDNKSIINLKPNTKYYVRPFFEDGKGHVTYYKGTTVTTVGNTPGSAIMLNLSWVGDRVKAEYEINMEGTFKVILRKQYFSTVSPDVIKDFGYKRKGDKEVFYYQYEGAWNGRIGFSIEARDINGITYIGEVITAEK